MNFLSRDFLYHRGLSKTTYRKGSGVLEARTPDPLSNVWRLGSLCLAFSAPNRRRPDHRRYYRSQFGSGSAVLRMEKNFGSGLKAVWGSVCACSYEEQQNNDSNARKLYERIIEIDPNGYFATKGKND